MLEMKNLLDHLDDNATHREEALAYRFLLTGDADGRSATLTWGEARRQVLAVAAHLQAAGVQPNDRALLVYAPGLEFIVGFVGCLAAGAIPVPAYPPDPARLERTLDRLRAIAVDCGAAWMLTSTMIEKLAGELLPQVPALGALRWVATDRVSEGDETTWRRPDIDSDSVAFLQYTSGSTGSPKGVALTHANLMENSGAIAAALGNNANTVGVTWLPLYHDMGLIGHVLQVIYVGCQLNLMSPLDFLQRPLRWLHAVSKYGGTISGAPDFAYALCARRATEADLATLDLSSWAVAFSAAEPVRAQSLSRFSEIFAPCGFRSSALRSLYGLAEATLMVTGSAAHGPPTELSVAPQPLEQGGDLQQSLADASFEALQAHLIAMLSERVGLPRAEIDPSRPFACSGYPRCAADTTTGRRFCALSPRCMSAGPRWTGGPLMPPMAATEWMCRPIPLTGSVSGSPTKRPSGSTAHHRSPGLTRIHSLGRPSACPSRPRATGPKPCRWPRPHTTIS